MNTERWTWLMVLALLVAAVVLAWVVYTTGQTALQGLIPALG